MTVLIISFYYLMEKSWIRRLVLLDSAPETRIRVSRIWDEVEQKVGDWLRGQLTLCLVIGVTATVGYAVLGIQFWPLLGLWAGITEIVPILGPWLGGVPAVIIALTQGWEKALLVIGFVVLLQLTENAVLVPRVMRGAVGLTPLTVFIAILAGTELRDSRSIAGDPDCGRDPGHAFALYRGAAGGEASWAIGAAGLAVDARLDLAPGVLSVSSGIKQCRRFHGRTGNDERRTGMER